MKVALTGATGLIGSHILTELREHDHEAVALVRDADQADRAAASRANPVVVDLYDRPTVVRQLSGADGAIHTASPGAATSANLDAAVADPAIGAFAGAGKPYLHISRAWIYGNNTSISEESPMNPPAFVAWKVPIQHRILNAAGMRGAVIVSSIGYGDGSGGIPALLLGSPRDDTGNLIMIGAGQQHSWTVHVADLANLFRRVPEGDSARGYHLVGDGQTRPSRNSLSRPLTRPALQGRSPVPMKRRGQRLDDYFAEVLLLDQGTPAAKARDELGWSSTHPTSSTSFATAVTASSRRVERAPA